MATADLEKDDHIEAKPKSSTLIAILVLLALVLLAFAYFFASKSAEPTYRNKIERLMFDKTNKSPKYVITLPDREEVVRGSGIVSVVKKPEEAVEEELGIDGEIRKEVFSPEQVIKNIPNIGKLTAIDVHIPLKSIDINPDFMEMVREFSLPKPLGHRDPWEEYGKIVSVPPNFHGVAVIFRNLGLDTKFTETISAGLNDNFSFSFSSYATGMVDQIKAVRAKGHETFIDIAFSSKDISAEDTGPRAIDLDTGADDVIRLLHKNISVKAPFGGILLDSGRMSEENIPTLKAVAEELKKRGLALVDATNTTLFDNIRVPGLAGKRVDIFITEHMKSLEVAEALKQAEGIALTNGQVLIVVDPKPYLVFLIKNWVDTFSPQLSYEEMKLKNIEKIARPFALVPASTMVVE